MHEVRVGAFQRTVEGRGEAMSNERETLMMRALLVLLEGVYLGTSGYKSSKDEARELVAKIAAETKAGVAR